ncbi:MULTISPECIES: MBOAT family O-acyltransferase [Niastella]|uniref:MBOAT family protein n=1 Tax=Niastella soli TaxID=2821487 RepID=A0ABS3Z3M8_9BACT|nr:MBOAT family protein [Niastella soli]MBO9204766.1 MBOAT family protein [Niastella soli]
MLFNSLPFLVFLPIVFGLYWYVFNKQLRWQNCLLLIASYFFYGWWSWQFMALLALSTFLDYVYGFSVASPNRKKARLFLWLSVINNLGILAVFKYYNFFAQQFQLGFEMLGLHIHPVLLQIGLPIGISFYTFHGMSYVFDIYRGKQKPISNFIEYAVFVAFFPLLVAGPIERATHLLPQIQNRRIFNYRQAVEGCRLILWGMFKKVVVADSLASIADNIFNNYPEHNGITLVLGTIAFSFQIYGDFSGYSDIALGTAKLFGFELLSNFRFPYFSRDIAEFWRRWHISLSSWFRDYLYIPLGGSKDGKGKAVRNTFIIFLVSGFWHGASWNFIAWGFIHACGFLPLLLLDRNRTHVKEVVAADRLWPNGKELLQMFTTFCFVSFAWIFFRIHNMSNAVDYVKSIFTNYRNPAESLSYLSIFFYILPLLIIDWQFRRNERRLEISKRNVFAALSSRVVMYTIYTLTALFLLNAIIQKENMSFIYFQF